MIGVRGRPGTSTPGRFWRFVSAFVWSANGVALMSGCGNEPDGTATLLRTFDALCVSTRLDEDTFHANVGVFGGASEIPADVLRLLSPDNTAGYYLTDRKGDRMAAVIGLTQSDEMESRNCGITASVGFAEANALVADHFPVEFVEQFDQGASRFAVFQGTLVGYAGNMAISVQGGYELTTVSIYELPRG